MSTSQTRLAHVFSELQLQLEDVDTTADESLLGENSNGGSGRSSPRTPRAQSLLSTLIARSHSNATSPTTTSSQQPQRFNSAAGLYAEDASIGSETRTSRGSGDSSSPLQRCSCSLNNRTSVPIPIPDTTYLVNPAHVEQRARLQQLRVWHRLQMQRAEQMQPQPADM